MGLCSRCGNSETVYDDARGETVCTGCGAILGQSAMVDQITFFSGKSGGVQMTGQMVSMTTGNVKGFAAAYGNRESREQTLQRGYNNLQRVADFLHLSGGIIQSAQRVYYMALQRNFTIGRNNFYVVAACLYSICRRDGLPFMLIDFADCLQTPVKVLGQVFMKLLRVLRIYVPHIDPSLFMERYASLMNLKEKTQQVAATGVRLIQVMSRDWIVSGRRPTGLCGAALLIAARIHGFKVNPEDIRSLVRISSATITKRMYEFRDTTASKVKVGEFENTDLMALPGAAAPPCVLKRQRRLALLNDPSALMLKNRQSNPRKKRRKRSVSRFDRQRVRGDDSDDNEVVSPPPSPSNMLLDEHFELARESEDIGSDERDRPEVGFLHHPPGEPGGGGPEVSDLMGSIPTSGLAMEQLCSSNPSVSDILTIASHMVEAIGSCEIPDVHSSSSTAPMMMSSEDIKSSTDDNPPLPLHQLMSVVADVQTYKEDLRETIMIAAEGLAANQLPIPADTFPGLEGTAATEEGSVHLTSGSTDDDSAESIGLKDSSNELLNMMMMMAPKTSMTEHEQGELPPLLPTTSSSLVPLLDEEETLSDVSDSEVEPFLNSEEEKTVKALVWDDLMKDILPELEKRQRDRVLKANSTAANPVNVKPKVQRVKQEPFGPVDTASASLKLAFSKNKRLSSQINEGVLDSVLNMGIVFADAVGSVVV